jgi:hypothetical protein
VLTFSHLATQTFPSVPAQHHVLEVLLFRATDSHRRPQAASASVHATTHMHERSNERTPFYAPLRRTLSCTVAAHVSSPHHPTIQDPLSITAVLCYRYMNEWVGWEAEGRYAPVPTLATSRLHGGLALLLGQGRIMLHVCAC